MNDRTILVTGSSRGLGRAIALELARAGFRLVLHCRDRAAGAEAVRAEVEACGSSARVLMFDQADREATRAVLQADVAAHGAYYGVVCNAGLHADAPFPGMEAADWDRVLGVNLDGFYNVLHPLVMPMIQLRDGGRIVTLSSLSGLMGQRGQVNYSAAKAGLIGATKALAIELGRRKITVNCVAPGLIETEMTEGLSFERELESIPLRRLGRPEEVAALVAFLCSDTASYITRQVISVNGGLV